MPDEVRDLNPYTPPAPRTSPVRHSGADEQLVFDGIITKEIFAGMLPQGREYWLFQILILLLAILLVAHVGIAGVLWSISKMDRTSATGFAIVMMILGSMIFFFVYMVSRASRTKRILTAYPDLLGVARGSLDQRGMLFFDGMYTHWFSWVHLAKMEVTSKGLRVPVDDRQNCFLSLASSLFTTYEASTAAAMLARFGKASATADEIMQMAEATFEQSVDSRGRYCGWVEQQVSLKTKTERVNVILALVSGFLLVGMPLFTDFFDGWCKLLMIGYGCYTLVSGCDTVGDIFMEVKQPANFNGVG